MKFMILVAATFTALGASTAVAIEEPKFEVVETNDDYEIRRYEPFIVAETEVPGDFDLSGSAAFSVLAGYIFGDNRATADSTANVKLAMTAPVLSTAANPNDSDRYVYRFVMPSEYEMETLPVPLNSRVTIREVSGRLMAVRRYSGRWTAKSFNNHEQALREALQRDGLTPVGTSSLARYNAPFTPWFMRRNEVMLELSAEQP
jgi:hypothetical protein